MRYFKSMKVVIIGIIWFAVIQNSFANGGPGEIRDILVSGHGYFEKVEDIVLEREDLTFDINEEDMNVNVVYTLSNQGEETDINYIFPVTRYIQEDDVTINDFKIMDNLQSIPFSIQDEKSHMTQEEHQYVIDTYGYDTRIFGGDMKTTYYITTLHFEANEKKQVDISYNIIGQYDSYGSSKSLIGTYSDTSYYYDLMPASYWGGGIVGEFNLRIDYQDILKYQSINVNIPGFLKSDTGIYTYKESQYNLAQQKNIIISYYHPYELKELEEYNISADSLDKIYVSSTLPPEGKLNYSALQMFDHNLDTGWVEGSEGFGIGDCIELSFEEKRVRVIGIINGYTKSRETYYNNARIKRIKIEAFQFDTQDKSSGPICVKESIYELEDLPYEQISKELYYNNVQLIGTIDEVLAYDKYVRITILEVYPGDKYQDTSISEMVFFESEYTLDPYTFKNGYTLSDQPIIKIHDQEKNYIDDMERSKTKIKEIQKKEGLENKIKTNYMRFSKEKEKIENNQNQHDGKKQIDIRITIVCSILSITVISLIIYLIKKKKS